MAEMKKRNIIIQYKYLITVLFIAVIFGMFFFNIKETAANIIKGTTAKSIGSVASDVENVEKFTYHYININGLYQNVMQRNYMYDVNKTNELVRINGEYLISAPSPYSEEGVTESAKQLAQTSAWLHQNGIPMLYVQAASKMTISGADCMPGIENTSYGKVNAFLKELTRLNVDYADTRNWITTEDMSAFYKTDHHWTTSTCLTVASETCNLLNNNLNLGLDRRLFDKDSFRVCTYENAFLGAEGRRTGVFYAGLDNFSVIKPEYDTEFIVDIHTKEGTRYLKKGQFENSIMDISKDPVNYSFEDSAYYIYWGGDYSSIHVENLNNNDQGSSLVVIKDSYGVPVTALMAGAFKTMDIFDVRYYNEDVPLSQKILEIHPDAVVFIYGTGYLDKPDMFNVYK